MAKTTTEVTSSKRRLAQLSATIVTALPPFAAASAAGTRSPLAADGTFVHIRNATKSYGPVGATKDHRGQSTGVQKLAPGIRRAWPGYKMHERASFLFIDESVIESMEGCAQGVAEAKKQPVGNLLPLTKPWETADGDLSRDGVSGWSPAGYINTMYDAEEKLFKMWYHVSRQLSNQRAETEEALAYATSTDGVQWHKPILNLYEGANGNTANNLVFPFMRWGTGTGVIKDPVEVSRLTATVACCCIVRYQLMTCSEEFLPAYHRPTRVSQGRPHAACSWTPPAATRCSSCSPPKK